MSIWSDWGKVKIASKPSTFRWQPNYGPPPCLQPKPALVFLRQQSALTWVAKIVGGGVSDSEHGSWDRETAREGHVVRDIAEERGFAKAARGIEINELEWRKTQPRPIEPGQWFMEARLIEGEWLAVWPARQCVKTSWPENAIIKLDEYGWKVSTPDAIWVFSAKPVHYEQRPDDGYFIRFSESPGKTNA